MKNVYTSMKSNFKLLFMTLILLFIGISAVNAQMIVGDYRSVTNPIPNNNWNNLGTWQQWNGTSWVTPATYPGQSGNVPGTVTIQANHTVTLNVDLFFNSWRISTLDILSGASLSFGGDRSLNVETINLNTGTLNWTANGTLSIPANSFITTSTRQ